MTTRKITAFLMCPTSSPNTAGGTPQLDEGAGGHIKKDASWVHVFDAASVELIRRRVIGIEEREHGRNAAGPEQAQQGEAVDLHGSEPAETADRGADGQGDEGDGEADEGHGSGRLCLRCGGLRQRPLAAVDRLEEVNQRLDRLDAGVVSVVVGDLSRQRLRDTRCSCNGLPARRASFTEIPLEVVDD